MTREEIAAVITESFAPSRWTSAWLVGRSFDAARWPSDNKAVGLRCFINRHIKHMERRTMSRGAHFRRRYQWVYISPFIDGEVAVDAEVYDAPLAEGIEAPGPMTERLARSVSLGAARNFDHAAEIHGIPRGSYKSAIHRERSRARENQQERMMR